MFFSVEVFIHFITYCDNVQFTCDFFFFYIRFYLYAGCAGKGGLQNFCVELKAGCQVVSGL